LILPNNLIPYLFRKKRAPTLSRTLTRNPSARHQTA
jgi:hypothetical protein